MATTYKLSPAAVTAIGAIVDYTDQTFGETQTAAYRVHLHKGTRHDIENA